ncbi:hypothetical protein [Goodfellowiella coeruleoviolacea]|uniref:Uncharacterized protein n=1 Tax=Goodfellowiella coeruleoviolacea TaxID=334858 RepID=A0AAE3GJJ8_9PSEU|nr:hypothetical protein [Goodfellowiella coeruleoviolacea]MCP2169391.1 hypothetical protein [Goodfellowiella coeruleoviolacea]
MLLAEGWLDLALIRAEINGVDPNTVAEATRLFDAAGEYLDEQDPEAASGFERLMSLARSWLRVAQTGGYVTARDTRTG